MGIAASNRKLWYNYKSRAMECWACIVSFSSNIFRIAFGDQGWWGERRMRGYVKPYISPMFTVKPLFNHRLGYYTSILLLEWWREPFIIAFHYNYPLFPIYTNDAEF